MYGKHTKLEMGLDEDDDPDARIVSLSLLAALWRLEEEDFYRRIRAAIIATP